MPAIIVTRRADFRRKKFSEGVERTAAVDILKEHKSFITVLEVAPDTTFPAHYHTVDQIIFVLEGGITNDRATEPLPPGSLLFLGKENVYNTNVGPNGVSYFGIRPVAPKGDWDESDIQHPAPGHPAGTRTEGFSAAQIAELPAEPVGENPTLTRRALVSRPDSPRIGFMEADSGNATPVTAETHTLLAVFSGSLRLDGRVAHAQDVASVPSGTTYTPAGEGGPAKYLMVERMPD